MSDCFSYRQDSKLSPEAVFELQVPYDTNPDTQRRHAKLKLREGHTNKVMDEYSLELTPEDAQGRIGVLRISNMAAKMGVMHGASPASLVSQPAVPDERQLRLLYRNYLMVQASKQECIEQRSDVIRSLLKS